MREKLGLWWNGRSGRERRMLAAWAALLAALLVWLAGLSPLLQRIAALEKRVPSLERQLRRMQSESPDSGNAHVPPGDDLRSALLALLAERAIGAELKPLSPVRVEMRLPELALRDALDLIDAVRRDSGTRVARLDMHADAAQGGAVRAVVELERAP